MQLLDPDDIDLESSIEVTGTAANPGWLLKLKAPRGPQGDNATIRDATDYDDTDPPSVGEAIVWNGSNFQAQPIGNIGTRLYSVPEANFTNFTGITTRQQIASFAVPPQEFAWVPYVTGHIRAVGVEADTDPLILGCEVRLGDPTSGVLIGRPFRQLRARGQRLSRTSPNQAHPTMRSPRQRSRRRSSRIHWCSVHHLPQPFQRRPGRCLRVQQEGCAVGCPVHSCEPGGLRCPAPPTSNRCN